MREHLGFLKASSAVVKIAAWIFLFMAVVGGAGAMLKISIWMGLAVFAAYTFMFFFLFLIAKIADLLIKIINEIHEIKKELREGAKEKEFDQLGTLLHGYSALQKVLKKVK